MFEFVRTQQTASGPRHIVKIDGDWLGFYEWLNDVDGDAMSIETDGGSIFQFKTVRERLSWADGYKEGQAGSKGVDALLDWIVAWFDWQEAEGQDKALKAEVLKVMQGNLSPAAVERGRCLVERVQSWMASFQRQSVGATR